jgi:hypothetical protein
MVREEPSSGLVSSASTLISIKRRAADSDRWQETNSAARTPTEPVVRFNPDEIDLRRRWDVAPCDCAESSGLRRSFARGAMRCQRISKSKRWATNGKCEFQRVKVKGVLSVGAVRSGFGVSALNSGGTCGSTQWNRASASRISSLGAEVACRDAQMSRFGDSVPSSCPTP